MSKSLTAAIIRQQRDRLLCNLNLLYPTPVFLKTIWRTVCTDMSYEKSNYKRDIGYFHDKGWIRLTDNPFDSSQNWDDRLCVLTAAGKEIAEGTMTDPAMEI